MSQTFYGRQSATMIDRPQLLLDSVAGPYYQKNTSNEAYYTPPVDELEQPGPTPASDHEQHNDCKRRLGPQVSDYITLKTRVTRNLEPPQQLVRLLQTGANPTAE